MGEAGRRKVQREGEKMGGGRRGSGEAGERGVRAKDLEGKGRKGESERYERGTAKDGGEAVSYV